MLLGPGKRSHSNITLTQSLHLKKNYYSSRAPISYVEVNNIGIRAALDSTNR